MALCEECPDGEKPGAGNPSWDRNPENISFSEELAEGDPLVIAAILKAAAEIYLEGLAAEDDGSG